MKEIKFTPTQGAVLTLGHQFDHKARKIAFGGYRHSPENIVYLKLEIDTDKYLIPLSDNELLVTQPMTNKVGRFKGQLVEMDSDNNLISNSCVFACVVRESIKAEDQYEIHDPSLDLWTEKVKRLYDEVAFKLENGEFKGEPFRFEDFTDEQLASLKGDRGDDAIVIPSNGMFTLNIEGNDLYVNYNKADEPPSLHIDDDGNLIFGEV